MEPPVKRMPRVKRPSDSPVRLVTERVKAVNTFANVPVIFANVPAKAAIACASALARVVTESANEPPRCVTKSGIVSVKVINTHRNEL